MFQFLKIAFRNLVKNQTRSLLLGGAVAGVALLLTVLLALIQGIKTTMIKNGTALMTGHVNIAGFYKISPSSAASTVTQYEKLYEIARKSVPEADFIIDRMKGYGKVISESDSLQVPMWGVDYNQEKRVLMNLELAPVEDYWDPQELKNDPTAKKGDLSELLERGTIVLFASQAKKLKVHVGDSLTVSMPTYRNMSNTKDVRLVAVLKDLGLMSQFSLFLHKEDVREIYQMTASTTGQLMIFLKNIQDVPDVEDRLRSVFGKEGYSLMEKEAAPFFMKFDRVSGESWTGQKIDITTWEDETSFLKWILKLLTALTYSLVIILLTIVVIGLMNALWMAIRERTPEIGTLRAIGMQGSQVFQLFLIEAFLLCFGGTFLGASVGFLLVELLNRMNIAITNEALKVFLMSNKLSFQIGVGELGQVFGVMLLFLMVGAIFPIWQGARMKPVTAMQSGT